MPEEVAVPMYLMDIWDAFWRLNDDRVWIQVIVASKIGPAMSRRPGPIPFTAIDCYARRYCYDGCAFDDLLRLVVTMDLEFRAVMSEKAAQPNG